MPHPSSINVEREEMESGSVEIVVADAAVEKPRVEAIVREAFKEEGGGSLFLGRFLEDFSPEEAKRLRQQGPNIVLKQYGLGCWGNVHPRLADIARAELGLDDAREAIRSDAHRVVVLSQVLNIVDEDLLSAQEVAELIDLRPTHLHLVLTGDRMPAELASLVAERSVSRMTVP